MILAAAGSTMSASRTAFWLAAILRGVIGAEPDPAVFDVVHTLIRKGAHVVEYAALSLLSFRAVRAERRGWRLQWSVICVVFCLIVAVADESLQARSTLRTGTPWDVLIDLAAAAGIQWILRRRSDPSAAQ
jgi:VanZ family protein